VGFLPEHATEPTLPGRPSQGLNPEAEETHHAAAVPPSSPADEQQPLQRWAAGTATTPYGGWRKSPCSEALESTAWTGLEATEAGLKKTLATVAKTLTRKKGTPAAETMQQATDEQTLTGAEGEKPVMARLRPATKLPAEEKGRARRRSRG
jgi:hypothetical protein